MKLYYAPGACSLSPHIVAREAGLDLDLCKVDLSSHTTEDGADYYSINPKGAVPALKFDGGEILTEGPAIVQYLADKKPDSGLAPGGTERYRLQEWLNFISTEVHKAFAPLFMDASDAEQQAAKEKIGERFDYIENKLDGEYLMDGQFTAADAYLFTMASWLDHHKIDTSPWPKLRAFQQRVAARPAVQQALREEGLLEEK